MVKAFDVTQTREYTLISDTGEDKTFFSLGVLDSQLHSFLIDKSRTFGISSSTGDSASTVNVNVEMQNYDIVRFALKGWRSFKDKDGTDLKFVTVSHHTPFGRNYNVVSPVCMDYVKPYIQELAREIIKDNTVTKEDEKSFSQPSTS